MKSLDDSVDDSQPSVQGRGEADAPSFVEIGRAVAAIGVTKRILVVCQDYGYLFALIWR